ncbi:WXG100 family type VII secretion target [Clostridium brassicae]|uniref:WXG100 family type VII secretion target n=1 Tax=Clostridium brassicae TaxID=2999072 RepID=A0ABT4D6V7_9CLOT|nr:WXG100 family type VII secretion target [Clostridium brassicae]MCY6958030.1 WXG100 family type VII secretion target [Clostridium brassicae]
MAGNKEIKLNEQAFDNAISKLTNYKSNLTTTKDNFNKVNTNLKGNWSGDGGTAFILSANVIEARFVKMMQELQEEINDLTSAKISMFGLDSNLANCIAEAILGSTVAGVVTTTSTATEYVKNELNSK